MGRRGPKPTPTAILEARGSWRAKARKDAGEVEPPLLKEPPRPPQRLGRDGREMWKRITPRLIELGVLAVTDLAALEIFCGIADTYFQAKKEMKRHGMMVVTPQGTLMKNPAVGIMRQAQADFLRGCACFGLTPADRPKLTAAAAQPDAEPDLTGPRLAAGCGDKPKYY